MCKSALDRQKSELGLENQNDTVLRKEASYIEIIKDEKEEIKCWKASRYGNVIIRVYYNSVWIRRMIYALYNK